MNMSPPPAHWTSPFAPTNASPQTGAAPRFVWRLYAFEISRRASKMNVGAAVRPRRVEVYAPYEAAARAGAGTGKDEILRTVAVLPWEHLSRFRRPEREEIADFYETVGNALSTGGGLALALNMAARMSRSPMMRGIIGALYDRVMHGEDLHVAMARFPRVFAPMQLAMVEATSATGLDKAGGLLLTVAQRLQRDGKVWRKFLGAIAYPLSLIALTLVGAIVLEIWALPPMVELFRTLGGRLPPITQAFYDVAQFLRVHAWWIFPVLGGILVGLGAAAPRMFRTRFWQVASVRVALFGPIVQWMALVRALGTFILLKQSGATVRDQFGMAAAAAGNCVVGDFFGACYSRIALGESIEEAFTAERHRLGDDGTRIAGKMEVGMAGGDLATLINRIVEDLNDRTEARLALLPNAVRWPLLIVCCVMIGAVALAIVLPYPNLIADVAHQQIQGTR